MIIRKKAIRLRAYRLGEDHPMEKKLQAQGLIELQRDGTYRLHSQETREQGQLARPGDYFKVDDSGAPYPNDRDFFEENHRHLEGDWYVQQAKPLRAWYEQETPSDALRFILERGLLMVDETSRERRYSAELWGTRLYGAADAVIVFSEVRRDEQGKVTQAEFYFIARETFEKTYDILQLE